MLKTVIPKENHLSLPQIETSNVKTCQRKSTRGRWSNIYAV